MMRDKKLLADLKLIVENLHEFHLHRPEEVKTILLVAMYDLINEINPDD